MSVALDMSSAAAQATSRRVGGSEEVLPPAIPRYIDFNALRGSVQPLALEVRTERTLEAFYALEPEWRRLEEAAHSGVSAFQSFDWCAAWCDTYVAERGEAELHLVTVWDGDRLVLIWPLMTTCVGPVCILRWLSDPYAQYGDVLVDPAYARTSVYEAAWQQIVRTSKADTIRLRHVRRDGFIHDFLLKHCELAGEPDRAPFLDLRPIMQEADYDARYSKSQRRRRKRIRSGLEALGPVSFVERGPRECDFGTIDLAVRRKREWLDARGLYSIPVKSGGFSAFLSRLAKRSGHQLHLSISELSAGDAVLSQHVAFTYFGRHLCYLTAHDNQHTDLSPARLHMDMSQRAAIAAGRETFDLLLPGDRYKMSWSSDTVEVYECFHPLSLKGKAFGFGFLAVLRPLLRQTYQSAPPGLRRLVARLY